MTNLDQFKDFLRNTGREYQELPSGRSDAIPGYVDVNLYADNCPADLIFTFDESGKLVFVDTV